MNLENTLRAEKLVAKRYENDGYAVMTEPPPSAIPFPLGAYTPDLIAVKGDEHIVIEVKSPGANINSKNFGEIANAIHAHKGWRFVLVTVSDSDLLVRSAVRDANLTMASVREHLLELDRLLKLNVPAGILFPRLWLTYVSALRLLMTQEGATADPLTDLSLLNTAYSTGVISFEEYQASKGFLRIRNEASHSLEKTTSTHEAAELREMVHAVLLRLESPVE